MDHKTLFFNMLRIRMIEEAIAGNYYNEVREMHTPIHLSIGQEAVAVGVCSALERGDTIFSNHRSHAHYLAMGGELRNMISELHNKTTGCSRGKGGSMHLVDIEHGVQLSSSIVAGNVSIATGYSLAMKMKKKKTITVVFMGDGATEEGSVYESICYAKLEKLPILYCCENNNFAISTPFDLREPNKDIFSKFSNIIQGTVIDGNDVGEVYDHSKKIVNMLRNGDGPYFLECKTYRTCDHSNIGDGVDGKYRTKEQVQEWKAKDPIILLKNELIKNNCLKESDIEGMRRQISDEITDAFEFARKSPLPQEKELLEDLYNERKWC